MMKLYSNSTDPFSHRCRIVLFEKGMDFEVIDVDLTNQSEDLSILSPYSNAPVLVEKNYPLWEVEQLMQTHKITSIPVHEENRLVGIIAKHQIK